MKQDKMDEAIKCLQDAFSIRRTVTRKDDAKMAITAYTLAQCLMKKGSLSEAERLLREYLIIWDKLSPVNEVSRAETLHELGRCLLDKADLVQAEHLLRQSLSVKRRVCTNDKATIATTLPELGLCLMKSNKLDEAQALLRESVDIRTDCPDTREEIDKTLQALESCLSAQRRLEEKRTVSYVVFGKQLQRGKWTVYVHIMHGSGTQFVYDKLLSEMEKQSYVLLHPASPASIGRCGEVQLTAKMYITMETLPWTSSCSNLHQPDMEQSHLW